MIRYRFNVDIDIEDDDQTDREFIEEHLRAILEERFKEDGGTYGVKWPASLAVRYDHTQFVSEPISYKEESDGSKSDEDR